MINFLEKILEHKSIVPVIIIYNCVFIPLNILLCCLIDSVIFNHNIKWQFNIWLVVCVSIIGSLAIWFVDKYKIKRKI